MLNKYIKNSKLRNVVEWVIALVSAYLLYVSLQTFVFKVAKVEGNSMEFTMFHNDRVVVARFSYWFRAPDYGDVIAFPFKNDPRQLFIKRIIGLPGDVIDLTDYKFTVNGQLLEDSFSNEIISANGNLQFPITVPENSYFVLGDNRNVSKDSRYEEVGCIPHDKIIGKVDFRIMPFSRIGFIK